MATITNLCLSSRGRPLDCRNGQGRLSLAGLAATGQSQQFPPPAVCRLCIAKQIVASVRSFACRCGASACGTRRLVPLSRHRGRDWRGSNFRSKMMSTIGTFTKDADTYRGTLCTLSLSVQLDIRPSSKDHEKAPDYRIFSADGEIGAAWQRTSATERDYLSCKIDEPTSARLTRSRLEGEAFQPVDHRRESGVGLMKNCLEILIPGSRFTGLVAQLPPGSRCQAKPRVGHAETNSRTRMNGLHRSNPPVPIFAWQDYRPSARCSSASPRCLLHAPCRCSSFRHRAWRGNAVRRC